MVNLMSNDVSRFDMVFLFLHFIWIMPIQAIVAATVMYHSVGVAALIGLLAIAIQSIPLQGNVPKKEVCGEIFFVGYLSKLQGKLRSKTAKRTDYRVKLMSEITAGIQVIKMYAWEKPFAKIVELSRKYVFAKKRGFIALSIHVNSETRFVS